MRGRFLSSLVCLIPLLPFAAQGAQVVVVNPEARELKRTAHRLRITVEQLQNARAVLQEATDLALAMEPLPAGQLDAIGYQWYRTHRSRAAERITTLLEALRRCAVEAEEVAAHRACTEPANELLLLVSELDSEQPWQWIRRWPPPPGADAEPAARAMEDRLRSRQLSRTAHTDQELAWRILMEAAESRTHIASTEAGRLVFHLASVGRRAEALAVIDQAVTDFRHSARSADDLEKYAALLPRIADVDPDRFDQAFALLVQRVMKAESANREETIRHPIGEVVICGPYGDIILLESLRRLALRPQLLDRTLKGLPELEARLEAMGGIDNIFRQRLDADGRPTQARLPGLADPTRLDLQVEADEVAPILWAVRAQATRNPGAVRQVLSRLPAGNIHLERLLGYIELKHWAEPDLVSLALEEAARRVSAVPALDHRARLLERLLAIYRQVEGEVPRRLFEDGFALVEQIREIAGQSVRHPAADRLELFLVADLAKDDMHAALRIARSQEDPERRLQLLRAVAAGLSRWFV